MTAGDAYFGCLSFGELHRLDTSRTLGVLAKGRQRLCCFVCGEDARKMAGAWRGEGGGKKIKRAEVRVGDLGTVGFGVEGGG